WPHPSTGRHHGGRVLRATSHDPAGSRDTAPPGSSAHHEEPPATPEGHHSPCGSCVPELHTALGQSGPGRRTRDWRTYRGGVYPTQATGSNTTCSTAGPGAARPMCVTAGHEQVPAAARGIYEDPEDGHQEPGVTYCATCTR